MAQTTFNFDPRTEQRLRALRAHYGAATKVEIVRKAIGLLEIAMEAENNGGEFGMVDASGQLQRVLIR